MQALAEVTLTRPWHWGIAIIGDPTAEVPRNVVTLQVRHAQDIDGDRFGGDWDWATTTIHVRSLVEEEATDRQVLCDLVLSTPNETVSLGDADGMLVIPCPGVRTRMIVTAHEVPTAGREQVWIDLVAVDD